MQSLSVLLLSFTSFVHAQTVLQSVPGGSDYTLTLANSPYIVNSLVTFSPTANVTIENGVQLIFVQSNFITAFGNLNCGCTDAQIINGNTKGLSNAATYIHMIGNESHPMSQAIFINQAYNHNAHMQFCNTVFENVQNGIVTTSTQYTPYTVHNCEFTSVHIAIKHSTEVTNLISNSYFHDINNVLAGGGVIFDHCLFRSFGSRFSSITDTLSDNTDNIAIRNSEIYGDGAHTEVCLDIDSVVGDPSLAVYNNTVSNCVDGIKILDAAISVRHNTITNCTRYGVYVYHSVAIGTVDVSYNTFDNIGTYDISLQNIETVNVINNVFIPTNAHNASVRAMDIEHINVKQNDFVSLKHGNLLWFEYVDQVNIRQNRFVNNENKHGSIYLREITENVTISENEFTANKGEYLLFVENGTGFHLEHNNISNNTMAKDIVFVNQFDKVQINANAYSNNKFTELISIQNSMQSVSVSHNIFDSNYIHSNAISKGVIFCRMNENISIAHNTFNVNGVSQSDTHSNLILVAQTSSANVYRNTFQNAINLDNVLYFDEISTDTIVIQSNNFMQSQWNIASYLQFNPETDASNTPQITVNLNNFYSLSHLTFFISSDTLPIDANNNYYDGIKSYSLLQPTINGICAYIDVSSVIEYPLYSLDRCWWQLIDCNTTADTQCDSDTPSPTHTTLNPSLTPTLSPTVSPSKTPTLLPTLSPSLSDIETTQLSTDGPTVTVANEKEEINNDTTTTTSTTVYISYMVRQQNTDSNFMVIVGSGGITLVFLLFGTILFYVFFKLQKLKKETANLNKQIATDKGGSQNKSIGIDAIGNDIYARNQAMSVNISGYDDDDAMSNITNFSQKSSNCKFDTNMARKKSSLWSLAMSRKKSSLKPKSPNHLDVYIEHLQNTSDARSVSQSSTPRPPPRKSRSYQPREILAHPIEEKKETERENSSALYVNYDHKIIEIEGINQTTQNNYKSSIDSDELNDNIVMTALNATMPSIGELSMTAKHSFSSVNKVGAHNKSNSFLMKIDIPIVDELGIKVHRNKDDEIMSPIAIEETDVSQSSELSEDETSHRSESSAFTIKSDEEHKMNINVELTHGNGNGNGNINGNFHNGYIGLMSPTDTAANGQSPPNPQMSPDQILYSLNFKLQKQHSQEQPGTPHSVHKLPKPKTKGHWM